MLKSLEPPPCGSMNLRSSWANVTVSCARAVDRLALEIHRAQIRTGYRQAAILHGSGDRSVEVSSNSQRPPSSAAVMRASPSRSRRAGHTIAQGFVLEGKRSGESRLAQRKVGYAKGKNASWFCGRTSVRGRRPRRPSGWSGKPAGGRLQTGSAPPVGEKLAALVPAGVGLFLIAEMDRHALRGFLPVPFRDIVVNFQRP
jgi:hypothetical protein